MGPEITIKQFLHTHVEGYLFKDLRNMVNIRLPKNRKIGFLGYPIASSILSGMELLGGLLQTNTFTSTDPHAGNRYFCNYWDHFFVPNFPAYRDFKDIFRNLIRNGIAHTYVAKTGIVVIKGDGSSHLKITEEKGNYYLIVDICSLYKDFINSYRRSVEPIVFTGTTSTITPIDIQNRLNEMITEYKNKSNLQLGAVVTARSTVPPSLIATLRSMNPSVSASGTATMFSGFTKGIF